jgi:hypothetical protein
MQRFSEFPLPETRYQPGRTARSVRDRSRVWLEDLPAPDPLGENTWKQCRHYLYAVDLFNFGYWWEAHEVLEGLWVAQGRKGDIALFLQGLIQVSAALLKKSVAVPGGARRLSVKGFQKIAEKQGVFFGVAIQPFLEASEDYIAGRSSAVPVIDLMM